MPHASTQHPFIITTNFLFDLLPNHSTHFTATKVAVALLLFFRLSFLAFLISILIERKLGKPIDWPFIFHLTEAFGMQKIARKWKMISGGSQICILFVAANNSIKAAASWPIARRLHHQFHPNYHQRFQPVRLQHSHHQSPGFLLSFPFISIPLHLLFVWWWVEFHSFCLSLTGWPTHIRLLVCCFHPLASSAATVFRRPLPPSELLFASSQYQ